MSDIKHQKPSQSQLISTRELANIIGYEVQTIRAWLCKDKLPNGLPGPKKIKNRHYWSRKDIDRYLLTFSVYSN